MKRLFYTLAALSLFSCTALNEEEWRYDDPGHEEPPYEEPDDPGHENPPYEEPPPEKQYCDFGPVTIYGGGCFEMEHANDCDLEWGKVVTACGS